MISSNQETNIAMGTCSSHGSVSFTSWEYMIDYSPFFSLVRYLRNCVLIQSKSIINEGITVC